MTEFQKSVDIYPDYAESQRSLAMLLEVHNRYDEAAQHYEMAIKIEPENSWNYNGLASCFLKLGRAGDAVPLLMKAIEVDPQNPFYKDHLDGALLSADHDTAISNFLATVRSDPAGFGRFLGAMQTDTNHVGLINNLAWAFATNPDSKLRDGKYAVRLAKRACEITGYQITVMVGTLAAAYAEAGRFDEAVATGQKACALASELGETNLLARNQELVALYQTHQPYHEPAKAGSP